MLTVHARAKLTLSLEVLGRRDDGYHEVVAVQQSISLSDTLHASLDDELYLRCTVPYLSGPANLAWQAANLLRQEAGGSSGAALSLEKAIPLAAGLGGGSVDAAAALVVLNRLWNLEWPLEHLQAIAARLGSDVPFALRGGTAAATGRGTELRQLPPIAETWFILLQPLWMLVDKTARLYGLLRPAHYSAGKRTRALAERLAQKEGLEAGLLGSVFDALAEEAYPGISAYRNLLEGLGAETVHLAGAGPTLFTVAPTSEVARGWAQSLRAQGHLAYAVLSVDRGLTFQE